MLKKWPVILLLCVVALAGAVEAWIITRPGIGISPDSIVYIASARTVLAGRGLFMPEANGQDVPLTHFPPGYPLVLAFIAFVFRCALIPAAKALNMVLFAANTALIAGWVYRRTERLSLAAFSAVIGLTAIDLLRIYSMAWSEPLFLFLAFGGLLLLDYYLDRPALPLLLSAAALTAAAVLTRYAGIASVGAGVIILFVCQQKPLAQKLKNAALFGFVSGAPLALWLLRNLLLTHNATTRKFVFHPVLQQMSQAAQNTLSLWLFQGRLPTSWALPVGIAVAVLSVIAWARYKKTPLLTPHVLLLVVFVASYILLMAVITLFFEAQLLVPAEYDRILCPLHVAFLVTFLAALSRGVWPPVLRYMFAAAAVAVSSLFVYAAAGDMRELSQDGQQFASVEWRTSPTLDYVRHLPPGMHVYTNGRMPIYLYANRSCFEIPPKTLLSTLQPYADYQNAMIKIAVEVRQGIAVVVDFAIEDLPQFPTRAEWEALLQRTPKKMPDGYIFAS